MSTRSRASTPARDSSARETVAISLVMPVWRPRPKWLRAAVENALSQTGCELELIVVDDGSPRPIASHLAGLDDPRLRLLRVPHGGTSHARNAGQAVARGNWIRFVDYDDLLPPDSTAHLVELAGSDAIAYGATVWCDEACRPTVKIESSLAGHLVRECLLDRFPVTLPAMLFPRWVVDRVGEWDSEIAVCQDWDFVLRALEHAPVRGDDRTALFYRRHPDGASAGTAGANESMRLAAEGMGLVLDRYFERHPEQRGTQLERRARASVELVLARSHREAYLAHLGRALQDCPSAALRELIGLPRALAARSRLRVLRALRGS